MEYTPHPSAPSCPMQGTEEENHPYGQVLAMAYVPMQRLKSVYEPEAAFCRGTLFPELDKPFAKAKGSVACG